MSIPDYVYDPLWHIPPAPIVTYRRRAATDVYTFAHWQMALWDGWQRRRIDVWVGMSGAGERIPYYGDARATLYDFWEVWKQELGDVGAIPKSVLRSARRSAEPVSGSASARA